MDENYILKKMSSMLQLLQKVELAVKKNNWDSVGKLLADVNAIQMEIKQNPVSVDDYSAKNPVFKKEYNALKGDVLKHIDINTAAIEEWRTAICSKIAGSKNTLDNISKYYKPAEGSYYVDTEE